MRHELKAFIDINLGDIASWTELSGSKQTHNLMGSSRGMVGPDKELIGEEMRCMSNSTIEMS